MKIRKYLIGANALLVLLLVFQVSGLIGGRETSIAIASWEDRPDSVDETTELSEHVVRVRVKKIREAEPITVRVDGEPGGVDQIPVEVVTLEVTDDDAKGNKKKGDIIEIFHTGHSSETPPGRRTDQPKGPPPPKPEEGAVEKKDAEKPPASEAHMGVLFSAVMGDPEYRVGEDYLLFLRKGPDMKVGGRSQATLRAVSPEGRWKVDSRGRLQPMSDKGWAKQLRGKPAKELKDKAAQAVAKGKGKPGG